MNEITCSSPANSAGTVSTARARPSVCASITTSPAPNVSRTGLARSATSETRRTASSERRGRQLGPAAELGGEPGPVPDELAGDQPRGQPPPAALEADHALGRPRAGAAAASPGRPPAARARPRRRTTPSPAARPPWSGRVGQRPGRDQRGRPDGRAGRAPGHRRTASRYRSVAASVMTGPSMSRQTPVSMGSVSSRLADGTTCAAAAASAPRPPSRPARAAPAAPGTPATAARRA